MNKTVAIVAIVLGCFLMQACTQLMRMLEIQPAPQEQSTPQ